MWNRSDIAADLPSPHDDEPPSVRADIVDELTDHLECALRRELLTTPSDGESARRRALDRFGDPAAIARKLWMDALREQIMSQRLSAVALFVLSLLMATMLVFVWRSQSTTRAMLESQQATTNHLLGKLEELAAREPSPPVAQGTSGESLQWNPLTVSCVREVKTDEPVSGVVVTITPLGENAKLIPQMQETTGANGQIDFGKVPFGGYVIEARLPWEKEHTLSCTQQVRVFPGRAQRVVFKCPGPKATAEIVLRRDPEMELRDQLWILGSLRPTGVSPNEWEVSTNHASQEAIPFVIRPDGKFALLDPSLATIEELSPEEDRANSDETPNSTLLHRARTRTRLSPEVTWRESAPVPPGSYYLVVGDGALQAPSDTPGIVLLSSFNVPGMDGTVTNNSRSISPGALSRRDNGATFMAPTVEQPSNQRPTYLGPGTREELIVEAPQQLRSIELAMRLPSGFVAQPVQLSFERGSGVLATWSKADKLSSYDLFVRHPVQDGNIIGIRDTLMLQRVEGTGLRFELIHFRNMEASGQLWLLLRPQESASLMRFRDADIFIRPAAEPPSLATERWDASLATHPAPATISRVHVAPIAPGTTPPPRREATPPKDSLSASEIPQE